MESVRFIESSERNLSIMSQKRGNLGIILSLFLGFFLFVSIYLRSSYVLDSSVGIATRYGLDGPGIESRWGGGDLPHPSRLALGPTQSLIQWVPVISPGVKRPGRGVDHSPPSSAEVKERVELYLYSPSGPLWPVLG